MANGQVTTGFSKPVVARYSSDGSTVSYTGLMPLARGVDVSIEIETEDDNNFYADNVLAESSGSTFNSGTVTLTVDGLLADARKLIMGLPTKSTVQVAGASVNVYDYDDRQEKPYMGLGFIVRTMEDGVSYYTPYILPKIIFSDIGLNAATQEENIDFQTLELEARIMRDDSDTHKWQRVGDRQTSETSAYSVLQALLGGQ